MIRSILFVHALSSLHPGVGQGLAGIDLPIAREKATNIPLVYGSSLKGTIRDRYRDVNGIDEEEIEKTKDDSAKARSFYAIFGRASNAISNAGAAQVSDAKLLLLPVRSLAGVFAWVTSPYLLRRFKRHAHISSVADAADLPIPEIGLGCCITASEVTKLSLGGVSKVALEGLELDFCRSASNEAAQWAEKVKTWLQLDDDNPTADHLCIVHDDVMTFFLETATEITAHIALDNELKTTKKGALWYEESLPAESVLYSLATFDKERARGGNSMSARDIYDNIFETVGGKTVQLGGKATVGQGLCTLSFIAETDLPADGLSGDGGGEAATASDEPTPESEVTPAPTEGDTEHASA